jgi:3-methyladenine DNA glycosylase AlkD
VGAHPELDRAGLRLLLESLYASDWFDLRSAGVAVLEKRRELLRAGDADWVMDLVRRSGNWAQVDWLSVQVLGVLVEENGLEKKLRRWARDPDLWVRRASLLSLLLPLRRGEGEFALFAELAAPMLVEKEFFIRKCIGWILREVQKPLVNIVNIGGGRSMRSPGDRGLGDRRCMAPADHLHSRP